MQSIDPHQVLFAAIGTFTAASENAPVTQFLNLRVPHVGHGNVFRVTTVANGFGLSAKAVHMGVVESPEQFCRPGPGERKSRLNTLNLMILSKLFADSGLPAYTFVLDTSFAKGDLCVGYTSKLTVAVLDWAPSKSNT